MRAAVTMVGTAVTPGAQSLRVEAELVNADHALKPGIFIEAELLLEERADVVVVPIDALIRIDNDYFVVLHDAGVARRRRVRLGLQEENRVEILEGLAPGESIIVVGQREVADGERVRVADEPAGR